MIVNIFILVLLMAIAACNIFFVISILKTKKFFTDKFFPLVKSKEYIFNSLDRDSYVNSLSLTELFKRKARIDHIIESYMEVFSTMLANKVSLTLGFRKKNSKDE